MASMKLRDALGEFSAGWRDDLSPKWRALLAGTNPNPLSVAAALTFDALEPIYPARRHTPLPGARADAHVFRAFDDIEPSQVRCVLIGQDPYPDLRRATGRSFEQGNLAAWQNPAASVAASLRVLLRMLVAARTGNDSVLKMNWTSLLAFAASPAAGLEPPRALFDRLQRAQGVLFLNAGLTITRYRSGGAPEQTQGHIPFWRPVVGQVLRALATRGSGHVVYLCLGRFAQQVLASEGVKLAAVGAGTWETRAIDVALPHPVAPGFIGGLNPFNAVNAKLVAMGASPILW
jgi:uracil-DNA glycosylase